MRDYYKILGVSEGATPVEIKKAYKRLALRYHPDRTGNDTKAGEYFKLVNEAYQVLSDEERKMGYDILRRYQILQAEAIVSNASVEAERPKRHQRTSQRARTNRGAGRYYDRRKAEKENTAIAFLVILSISFIILFYYMVSTYLENERMEERRAYRASLFSEAQYKYTIKDYEGAVAELDTLLDDMPDNGAAYDLKDRVIDDIGLNAKRSFDDGKYEQALVYYEMLNRLNELRGKDLKFRLGECLEAQGLFEEAIGQYKEILDTNPREIEAHYKIGKVYYEGVKDLNKAEEFFANASRLAIAFYKTSYGAAYTIVLDPSELSHLHFELFINKARLHLSQGNLEQAHYDCNWALILRPNIALGYLISGNIYLEEGKSVQACLEWAKAISLGNKVALGKKKEYCK
ncbi:DnaJ domain-containing protein [Flammeovirgaceae bacterium SG7u.111]|nr:DnaJ domain-containing protein [Flammeovirgaceae bacterium SG7u.132]WPO35738.1 DnaJ domain-containing protein [Flammeovirgaceae bacterium SG7u.111]